MDKKETEKPELNLVDEYMKTEDFKNFFPDQIIVFRSFDFPVVIIQTIFEKDLEKYNSNPADGGINSIEYQVKMNYKVDPDYIGPEEDADSIKVLDPEKPFLLSIETRIPIDEDLEDEYLEKFKTVFLKIIDLILENIPPESEDTDAN